MLLCNLEALVAEIHLVNRYSIHRNSSQIIDLVGDVERSSLSLPRVIRYIPSSFSVFTRSAILVYSHSSK
jgi:hypothetical protein